MPAAIRCPRVFPSKDVICFRDGYQLTHRVPSMQGFRMIERHRHIAGSVHNQVRNLQSLCGTFHIQAGTVLLKVFIELDVMRHVLLGSAIANEQHPIFRMHPALGRHETYFYLNC